MAETVAWYEDVLGMKLVKTLELPGGRGQHFFLDMGNGVDGIAFFWFPEAPEGVRGESLQDTAGHDRDRHDEPPRVRRAAREDGRVPREAARARASQVTEIINHSDSLDGGHKADYDPDTDDGDVFVRSMYFADPNGTLLEFASWTREFRDDDVKHTAATAAGAPVSA